MNIIIVYSSIYMHIIHIIIFLKYLGIPAFLNGLGSCQPIVGMFALQSVDGLACVKEQRVVMFLGPVMAPWPGSGIFPEAAKLIRLPILCEF